MQNSRITSIFLFASVLLFYVLPSSANMYGSTYIECKSFEKIPAIADGKSVCVLKVNCLYGPAPESMKDQRKWREELVTCDQSKCGDALKCARDIGFGDMVDLKQAKIVVQNVRKIQNEHGDKLFPNFIAHGLEIVNPAYFNEPVEAGSPAATSNPKKRRVSR